MRVSLLAAILAFCLLAPAAAQDAASPSPQIELSGPDLTSTVLTLESLAGLPQVEMDVVFQTSKGESKGHYKGVLLWNVLNKAGLGQGADAHFYLRNTFVVTGRDGYAIAFSVGEIAPDFGNRPVLLATDRDGQALPPDEGLRVIVPGDKRGARSVRDVVKIELR